MKTFLLGAIISVSASVFAQQIKEAPLFYFPSLDSIAPFGRGVFCGAVIDWKLDVKNLEVKKKLWKNEVHIKFLVNTADTSRPYVIDQFVADTNYRIMRKLEFEVTRQNLISTKIKLKDNEVLMFCLDGGIVYYFDPE